MNAADVSLDTKQRIINGARILFAKYGFEGTSIREIARQCEVNIAAVNYHFKNKENLFWEIMTSSYDMADQFCREYSFTSKDTLDFSMKLFERFWAEGSFLRNTMKMVLTEGMCPDGVKACQMYDRPFEPPGAKYLAEFVRKEVSYPLSEEGVTWAVGAIFSAVTHWAMMLDTDNFKNKIKKGLVTPEQIRWSVSQMVKAYLEHLKNNEAIFRQKTQNI